MKRRSYKDASQQEIIDRANQLLNHSLRSKYSHEAVETLEKFSIAPKNKGKLGNLVEILHFGLTTNSDARPDFEASGIELKTTGMIQRSKEILAKERLSLGTINFSHYKELSNCDFEKSGILEKCGKLLLMFYLYERDAEILDLVFKLTELWEIPDADKEIIRQDFEKIVSTIRAGKAEELSEGATFYLGASTTGVGHGAEVSQPFSRTKAKPRRFSFRKPYLDHILAKQSQRVNKKYGRIYDDPRLPKTKRSLEDIVIDKFKQFYGMSFDQMIKAIGIRDVPDAKHSAALLTKAVFKIQLNAEIEEFEKAGIITKTVRLEPSELPKQSISFPAFEYTRLVNETWKDSEFKQNLESKFFIVFFQYDKPEKTPDRKLFLKRVMFWNMPDRDIDEAEKVWNKTVSIIKAGTIVKGYKFDCNGKRTRETYFPGQRYNSVAHARPHGSDSDDTNPLPVPDIFTKNTEYTKYCFWINYKYVRDKIYRA